MMDHLDSKRFSWIDPLSHRQTTQERIATALLYLGGAVVFVFAFLGVLATFVLFAALKSGVVS